MVKQPEKRVYGRRTGRPLNKERQDALEILLPKLGISTALLKERGDLDPEKLFDTPVNTLWFEIGFGNGEHLAALMERHPDQHFIGAEPFINGMSAFLKMISLPPLPRGEGQGGGTKAVTAPSNVRVLMDDAMLIANSLCEECLDGIYILNPDPWHKKRHHKRRIVHQKNLTQFARILKPGGRLIMSTDVPDLAGWMVTEASRHPAFCWTAAKADDWRTPPPDWITTRYEGKRAKGADKMVYLIFESL